MSEGGHFQEVTKRTLWNIIKFQAMIPRRCHNPMVVQLSIWTENDIPREVTKSLERMENHPLRTIHGKSIEITPDKWAEKSFDNGKNKV